MSWWSSHKQDRFSTLLHGVGNMKQVEYDSLLKVASCVQLTIVFGNNNLELSAFVNNGVGNMKPLFAADHGDGSDERKEEHRELKAGPALEFDHKLGWWQRLRLRCPFSSAKSGCSVSFYVPFLVNRGWTNYKPLWMARLCTNQEQVYFILVLELYFLKSAGLIVRMNLMSSSVMLSW